VSLFDPNTPGAVVAQLEAGPVSRHMLALFCGASGDHNPVHVDIDFAQAAGHEDVFAHGMLVMAQLGRLLPVDPSICIDQLACRFKSITRLGDVLSCRARLIRRARVHGRLRVELQLEATAQDGEVRATGTAVLSTNYAEPEAADSSRT
jgi:acyl dehydratase